ncbi:MAG: hypothetical protein QNJ75_12235 [Acidimicrobiia bacterium]|nr:hypothetical protein [Acidimicrobiia bacterium]
MSKTDLVMRRLAEADPAPTYEEHGPDPRYSVLFDTIWERNEGMQTTTITPWWRRGPVVAIAVFVLIVGAAAVIASVGAERADDVAGGGGDITVPPASVTTAPPTTAMPEPQPHEYALALWAARYGPDSDPEVWRSFLSADFPAFNPVDWVWLDDFDGDGVVAFADWVQFEIALNGAMGTIASYECETVSEETARCVGSATDAFYGLGGIEPPEEEVLLTFDAGKLVDHEVVDRDRLETLAAPASDARYFAMVAYEEWIAETYPDRYPALYEPPCCDAFVTLPSAIPEHEELMAEYLEIMASS